MRLGTEALVTQSGAVTTTVGGAPLTFQRAARTVDVAGMTLGLFHAGGSTAYQRATLELLGAQGSYLEGGVFEQVVERHAASPRCRR